MSMVDDLVPLAPVLGPSCMVVIPCYNEAARLNPRQFYQFLDEGHPVHFLLVNDGSGDTTLQVLQEMQRHRPDRIFIMNNVRNMGKAESVRLGMLTAIELHNSAFTGFWDADLATPLSSIPKLMEHLALDAALQMVFGARVRLLGREIKRRAVRHYSGRVFATVASLSLGIPIYDTQCGAKLFRISDDLARVLKAPFLSRWIFDVEIIARFLALHREQSAYARSAIYEMPLDRWEDVDGSKVSALDFARSFVDLIYIRHTYSR